MINPQEDTMEEEPINTVIAMLKDAREEIGGLISDYESGRIPPQELVAETFEIGKMGAFEMCGVRVKPER